MIIRSGTMVRWRWGEGHGSGKVVEVFTADVTRTLKGAEVMRHASADKPAYLIETDDGSRVLKSCTEVERRD